MRLGAGELQCFNERSGQTFVDVFQHNWSLTKLYLFQELGLFFDRMLRFAEQQTACRWTGAVAWEIEEVTPGVYRASWVHHHQHVVWCEDNPRMLFWRYRESRLHEVVVLAREVAECFYVARPGACLPEALVARGRFHDWCRCEDYSFPSVQGWVRMHRGARRLHAPSRWYWLSTDPLCPCFLGCRRQQPQPQPQQTRETAGTSSHADLVCEFDMSELDEVTVRHVAPSRLARVLFPDGCCLCFCHRCFCPRSTTTTTPCCEFVLRFSHDPGAVVVLAVDGADAIAMWRRALERCLWVNRSTKKLRAVQRRRQHQQQGSIVYQHLLFPPQPPHAH